jgi:hypothetical protein
MELDASSLVKVPIDVLVAVFLAVSLGASPAAETKARWARWQPDHGTQST